MLTILSKYRFWIILFLLFFFLRLPSFFEPYWYGDEGIYLVLGQAVRRGLTLYQQIHDNKPPTLYYLAALSHTVFGFRLLLTLIMIPTIILFYRLSQNFFTLRLSRIATFIFTLVSSIPLIEGTIANAEVFMLLPTILAIILLLSPRRKLSYLISGLLLGVAFTIKVPVAIELLFLILWVKLEELDFSIKKIKSKIKPIFIKVILLSLGFALPVIALSLYYFIHQAGDDFLFAAFLQNFGYLSSWSTGTHTSSVASGGLITRFIVMLFSWIVLLGLYFLRALNKKFLFIFLWLSATIFGALLPARPYPHYLIQVLPPLVLVITSLFLHHQRSIKSISLIAIFILVTLTIKYKFYYFPVLTYYKNFYSYALGQKSIQDYRQFFGPQVNQNYQISQYIKNHTFPDDRIYVWGDEPYIYALSDRIPSGKYTVAYHVVDFKGHEPTIESFKAHPPKYIIYFVMPHRPFPQLDKFILKYYSLDNLIGSAYIFKKR